MKSEPEILIYHNPRCSKSRATLELLKQRDYDPIIIEYLKNPPDRQALENILDLLGMEPRQLMRRRETPYMDNGLDDQGLSRDQLIAAMIKNPILIERPIVLANDKAAIGRPPEAVLELF